MHKSVTLRTCGGKGPSTLSREGRRPGVAHRAAFGLCTPPATSGEARFDWSEHKQSQVSSLGVEDSARDTADEPLRSHSAVTMRRYETLLCPRAGRALRISISILMTLAKQSSRRAGTQSVIG